MGMNDLFGAAGAKPKLITVLTSGTGTYIPTVDNARCLIRRQGAGGGGGGGIAGGTPLGSGGSAGAYVETTERIPIAGVTYAIGAKGIGGTSGDGTSGGATRFNNVTAPGGLGCKGNNGGAVLGQNGAFLIIGDGAGTFGLINGVSGGASGNSSGNKGYAPGFSITGTTGNGQSTASANTSGGGDAVRGKGGNGGPTGTDASGPGGGGGGSSSAGVKGGDGGTGEVEVWDYGA